MVLDNDRERTNKEECRTCAFFIPAAANTGYCSKLGALQKDNVLILDNGYVLKKLAERIRRVKKYFNIVVVATTFGCVYHKKRV